MAPEQLAHGKVSVRSDSSTLGLILYELFTGKGVFDTNDIEELKRKHTSGTVSAPSSISEEIDPAVEGVVMRCLEQQPEQRPQSVYQVLAALPGGDPLAAALAAGETPVGNLDRIGDPVRAPGNLAQALNGRPFLMQMGRNDRFCTVEQAQRLYVIIPGSKAAKWLQDGLK